MKIGKTIRFFREQLDFMQKELVNTYVEASSISRIEQGKQGIKVDALFEVLNTMSITSEEFVARCPFDKDQSEWRALVHKCSENKDSQAKSKLIEYYDRIKEQHKSLKELSNFIIIKCYFSRLWEEIDPLTKQEILEAYVYLEDKTYYQHYDYVILNNIIMFLDSKQQEKLIVKVIPILDEGHRDEMTKKYAYNTVVNLVITKLYDQEYEAVKRYLKLAESLDKNGQNYNFRMSIEYLKNLFGYLMTGEAIYMQNIYAYVRLLEVIGDTGTVEAVKKEVKHLTYEKSYSIKDNNFPLNIFKN